MTDKIETARAAIINTLAALDACSGILALVRQDMERRLNMPNRETRVCDVTVEIEGGHAVPFVTLETDPDTGFVTMIDVHVVAPGDVTMAEGAHRQAKANLRKALAALDSADPKGPVQ